MTFLELDLGSSARNAATLRSISLSLTRNAPHLTLSVRGKRMADGGLSLDLFRAHDHLVASFETTHDLTVSELIDAATETLGRVLRAGSQPEPNHPSLACESAAVNVCLPGFLRNATGHPGTVRARHLVLADGLDLGATSRVCREVSLCLFAPLPQPEGRSLRHLPQLSWLSEVLCGDCSAP